MIVWTHAVLGVLYARVLYFCICTCSAQFSMFDMERRSRNTLIIIIIIIIIIIVVVVVVVIIIRLLSDYAILIRRKTSGAGSFGQSRRLNIVHLTFCFYLFIFLF